jgi:glycine cleavage system H protein
MNMFSLIVSDPFATKGIEYLLALTFLAALTLFWHLLSPARRSTSAAQQHGAVRNGWHIPDDRRYYKGHSWAQQVAPGIVRVGLNDFAQQLLGPLDQVFLPRVRSRVRRGQKIWQVKVDGHAFRLPSPVSGRVLRINPALQGNGGLVNKDPYGSGWLMELNSNDAAPSRGALHGAEQVRQWLSEFQLGLGQSLNPQLGTVLQDGGTLIEGFALTLPAETWQALVQEQLLAEPMRLTAEGPGHDRQT